MKINFKSPFFWLFALYFGLIAVGISKADYGDDLICYQVVMREEGLAVDRDNPVNITWDHSLTEEENLKIIETKLGKDFVCV